ANHMVPQQVKLRVASRYRAGQAIGKFGTVNQDRTDPMSRVLYASEEKKRNLAADATLSVRREGLIMTNRRRSATARSVPAQTPEQLLELTQQHIRPLIPLITRLNAAAPA